MRPKDFFREKKVLITGHTGFKGAWMSHLLLNWGAEVIGVSLDPPSSPHLFGALGLEKRMKNYHADVRDYDRVLEIFKKENPEIIFHLAAQAIVREGYDRPLDTFSTNIMGTANVLHAATKIPVRAVVTATTDKVYENLGSHHRPFKEDDKLGGHDPYSASKVGADFIAQTFLKSLPLSIVRAGNIIGGGDWGKDRLIPDIVRAAHEGNSKIILRYPYAIRPWQHVLDPIHGCLILARELASGNKNAVGAWNFGPDEANFLTVEEIAKRAHSILGQGQYEIAAPQDGKVEEVTLTLDASKARQELSWSPRYHIDEALHHTLDWYKHFYEGGPVIKITDDQISAYFYEL